MLVTLPVLVGGWSLAGWRQGLWLPGQHCNFFICYIVISFYLLYILSIFLCFWLPAQHCHIFLPVISFIYFVISFYLFLSFCVFVSFIYFVISFYLFFIFLCFWLPGQHCHIFLSNVLHIEFANLTVSFSWALLGDLKSMHNIRIAHMCDAIIHVASFHT